MGDAALSVSAITPAPEFFAKATALTPFIEYLGKEPLLKAILAGHEHIMVQDVFSPTAVEYVVGGNYMFAAREVLVI